MLRSEIALIEDTAHHGRVAWRVKLFYCKGHHLPIIGPSMINRQFWKIALLVFAIIFQMADTAYASNSHDCCEVASPCCVMMTSSKTCSPCISPGIVGLYITDGDIRDTKSQNYSLSITYPSIRLHVIWRPPIK